MRWCSHVNGSARGNTGESTRPIHDRTRQWSRCAVCRQTWCAWRGTIFEGRRTPTERRIMVITWRSSRDPVHALMQACGLEERPVAVWRDRAGQARSSGPRHHGGTGPQAVPQLIGLCFACARGFSAQPPVRVALPDTSGLPSCSHFPSRSNSGCVQRRSSGRCVPAVMVIVSAVRACLLRGVRSLCCV